MLKKKTNVLFRLLILLRELIPVMLITVISGLLGYFSATAIPIAGVLGILKIAGLLQNISVQAILFILIAAGVIRGLLRYLEHYTGHYIAFKLLAVIRDKVFKKLRQLSPAKLETKEKGSLISLITSDIETMEVFYAHTVAPVTIALLSGIAMTVFIGLISSYVLGLFAAAAYITVGFVFPLLFSKKLDKPGKDYRRVFSNCNSYFLDSVKGIKQTVYFDNTQSRLDGIDKKSAELEKLNQRLKSGISKSRALTDTAVYLFVIAATLVGAWLYSSNVISLGGLILAAVTLYSSFGPFIALSALPSNLNQTFASGERLLSLLEEKPQTEEITDGADFSFESCEVLDLSFGYKEREILKDCNLRLTKNKIIGIYGGSGSGKSTLLKLLMRFWQAEKGAVIFNGNNVNEINSYSLRSNISYVTQDTSLYAGSVSDNISLDGKGEICDIKEACRKASVSDFVESLPDSYETKLGFFGRGLSSGERQRIGLARAFFHGADLILLDEPTSNVDSLNEKIILNSVAAVKNNRCIVIVSHKISTLSICDEIYKMENGRLITENA